MGKVAEVIQPFGVDNSVSGQPSDVPTHQEQDGGNAFNSTLQPRSAIVPPAHRIGRTMLSLDGGNAFSSTLRPTSPPALAEIMPTVVPRAPNPYAGTPPQLLPQTEDGPVEAIYIPAAGGAGYNRGAIRAYHATAREAWSPCRHPRTFALPRYREHKTWVIFTTLS